MKICKTPLICGINPGWADTIWSSDAFFPGASSVGLQIGCFCLDLDCHGRLWAWPNRHAKQIGLWPFSAARRFRISLFSAIVMSFGEGVWCNRQWWLIISSWSGERLCVERICSSWEGSMFSHSRQYSWEVCGIEAISGFLMKLSDSGSTWMTELWECLTAACKAFSLANAKEKGTDGLVIRSLDD